MRRHRLSSAMRIGAGALLAMGLARVGWSLVPEAWVAAWNRPAVEWRTDPLFAPAPLALMFASLTLAAIACLWRTRADAASRPSPDRFAAFALLGFALSMFCVWTLRAFPNSADEYDYIFQAQTFLAGRLWNTPAPASEFFSVWHLLVLGGKWISQYQPGWALLMAGGHLFGVPYWLLAPVAGLGLLWAVARLAAEQGGPVAASLAVLMLAVSPFFTFNAASYFSHVPAALFGVLFCLWGRRFLASPGWPLAFATGAALGAVGLIRPFDAAILGAVFAIEFLVRARTATYWTRATGMVAGAIPFAVLLIIYDWAITGRPLQDVISAGFPTFRLGLHPVDEFGFRFWPGEEVRMAGARLYELAEWSSPILVLGYGAALLWKLARRESRFHDLVLPAFIVAYLLFPGFGANRYGPRYYFEAFPLMAVTVGTAIAALLRSDASPRLKAAVRRLTTVHVATALAGLVLFSVTWRHAVVQRMDLYDQVRSAGLRNALVIVRSGTGELSPMPPMDLVRNGIDVKGDVIYALDLPGRRDDLRSLYRDRTLYVYERPEHAARGRLSPVD